MTFYIRTPLVNDIILNDSNINLINDKFKNVIEVFQKCVNDFISDENQSISSVTDSE
jgi:hypothetical protein